MSRFGTDLMMMFLATAWPQGPEDVVELATWSDVERIMFDVAMMAHGVSKEYKTPWTPRSVEVLDEWLMAVSENGKFEGETTVPKDAAVELERRAKFAVAGAALEREFGAPLNLRLPGKAPDGLKGWALVLYVLGGPARDYPDQFAH